MADIRPFRGIRYCVEQSQNVKDLVAPPYDVIDGAMQQALYDAHPHNVVRIIQGKEEAGDSESVHKYTRAAGYFQEWQESGVLQQDDVPGIYVYVQDFDAQTSQGTVLKSRMGIVVLVKIEAFGEGSILPHEHTMPGPKADRLALMQHTGGAFGQIFSLYSDPEFRVQALLDPHLQETPLFVFEDGDGVTHRFWRVTDEDTVQGIVDVLSDKPLFIADGHHRYETAVTYRDDRAKIEGVDPADQPFGYGMQTLVNMDDTEGMAINPIHRVVVDLGEGGIEQLKSGLSEYFQVETVPFSDSRKVMQILESRKDGPPVFAMVSGDASEVCYLTLRGDVDLVDPEGHSDAWRRLDTGLLQMVLGQVLNLDTETLIKGEKVQFVKVEKEVVNLLKAAPDRAGFFLNATGMDRLRAVVLNDERMPPKSTFFYPKVFSGLVMQDLNAF
ncbi:MAG: DUF1015 domain-containing protein [bacterium]|nr:DUF1015 domain-containing protein [bacterium]